MAHRNAETYRQLYEYFLKRDVEGAKELISPDVRWHEAGLAEPIRGLDALVERFSTTGNLSPDVDIHDILANDEHTIALVTARMRKASGDTVSYKAVEVMHFEDGMLTERWAFMDAVPEDVQAFFADVS
jgi:ketosteroid isomerase-like protein